MVTKLLYTRIKNGLSFVIDHFTVIHRAQFVSSIFNNKSLIILPYIQNRWLNYVLHTLKNTG